MAQKYIMFMYRFSTILCLVTVIRGFASGGSNEEPTCMSRFDYDFKMLKTLVDITKDNEDLREALAVLKSRIDRPSGKQTSYEPPRGKTNNVVSEQVGHKPACTSTEKSRSLKFRIFKVEEELYYPSSENKGADQIRSYCEADLRFCFRLGRLLVFP